MLVLWSVALGGLILTAVLCWAVVVPVIQVRAELRASAKAFPHPLWSEEACKHLGGPEDAGRKLILYLSAPRSIGDRPELAARVLAHCGERGVSSLARLLLDESAQTRSAAAWALGHTGSQRGVAPLILALQDNDEQVRVTAAQSLGCIGNRRAVPALIRLLQDPKDHVRGEVATSLGWIKDTRAVKPLAALVRDGSDQSYAYAAACALADIGPPALPVLEDLAKSGSQETRRLALNAINTIRVAQAKQDQKQ